MRREKPSVRDAAYQLFRDHGMTTVFGNPGSTELAFLAGMPADFRYVLSLQEGAAVAMADGYAQATGHAALVNVHTTAGVAAAMGALVNTAAARVPLVVTAGQQVRSLLTMEALLTNPDPVTLPRPLVKWSFEPPRPQDIPAVLARAIALANQPPCGPVLVSLPADDWAADVEPEAYPGRRVVSGRQGPLPGAIEAVAGRLATARNPVLLVGAGLDTDDGWDAAVELADRCALPVYWAPLEHRCGFPTVHPAYQGVLPATPAGVRKALEGHDLILSAGAATFRYYLPGDGPLLPAGAELVMLTADPDQAARAPVGDAVVGDVALALRWLAAATPAAVRPTPAGPRVMPVDPTDAISPAAVYATLAEVFPPELIVVSDSPSTLRTCQDQVRFCRPGSFFAAAGAGLGFGVPAAVGIQLARPDRPAVAIVGDGALQYTAPALWTAVQHAVPVTVIVLSNNSYGILQDYRERMGLASAPGLELPGLDNLALARGYGMPAQRAETPTALAAALHQAISRPGPRLIEVPIKGTATPLW